MLYCNFEVEKIQPLRDKLSKDIKAFIEKALEANRISIQDLGKSTGYGEDGIRSCLKHTTKWDIDFCFWIANEVGYPINLIVGGKLVNITFGEHQPDKKSIAQLVETIFRNTSPGFAYKDLEKK